MPDLGTGSLEILFVISPREYKCDLLDSIKEKKSLSTTATSVGHMPKM